MEMRYRWGIDGENTVWIDCFPRGEEKEKERRERELSFHHMVMPQASNRNGKGGVEAVSSCWRSVGNSMNAKHHLRICSSPYKCWSWGKGQMTPNIWPSNPICRRAGNSIDWEFDITEMANNEGRSILHLDMTWMCNWDCALEDAPVIMFSFIDTIH